jgi:hypothetical protein
MAESLLQNFNHLKIHTQYSICEGAVKIDDLQEYSKSNKILELNLSLERKLTLKFMIQLDYYLYTLLMKQVIKILLICHQHPI